MSAEHFGVLVVRIWLEGPDASEFRARVTSTFELEGEPRQGLVASSPEATLQMVKRWLDEFIVSS
jgi:hypothetical protein